MSYTTETIHLPRGDESMPVHRWLPANPRGGIVLVQEIFGVSSYIRNRTADLAEAGYLVDVPDLFFRHENSVVADDDPNLLQRGMELMNATPWDGAIADIQAATANLSRTLDELGAPQRIGLVGFCYGGGLAYSTAAQDDGTIDALVSYYGSALPNLLDLDVTIPSLHHFGTADAFIPMPEVVKIKAKVESNGAEFHLYDGADHAFDNTLPAFFHAEASKLAWERTLKFLADHVG